MKGVRVRYIFMWPAAELKRARSEAAGKFAILRYGLFGRATALNRTVPDGRADGFIESSRLCLLAVA